MGDTPYLHIFCKRCGSTFQNVATLFGNGIIHCKRCGEKRQFILDKTNINPAPLTETRMISKQSITLALDGYSSELETQETKIFPAEEWISLQVLNTILRGLIDDNTIYTNNALKHIYELLSHTSSFDMLVKVYQKLNQVSTKESPAEVVA